MQAPVQDAISTESPDSSPLVSATSTPTATPILYPSEYTIPLKTHVFQTFNNCGPASLSMALSYFDINISQTELGNQLRPYQNPQGDNDDKSTTLAELAQKAEELGFIAYHRPMGDEEIIKKFIANDIPIVTRTITKPDEDIGHYRLLRGYTDEGFIQDDSLQGKGLYYTFSDFNDLWKIYNYEYLAIVPEDNQSVAEGILGTFLDENYAWQEAVDNSLQALKENPNDTYAIFNASVAYYNIGDYQSSIEYFEKVENQLSMRTLWYQIEPIKAYFEVGNYEKVFSLTDSILENHNRAFSELYIIRGDIYMNQSLITQAIEEYEKAVFYNASLLEAKQKLESAYSLL